MITIINPNEHFLFYSRKIKYNTNYDFVFSLHSYSLALQGYYRNTKFILLIVKAEYENQGEL